MSLERVAQDLRFALRLFRRSAGFSAVAVLTLALGIGVNTAVFSVVDAVLLRPLPLPEPERLVRLWEAPPGSVAARNEVNPLNYLDWRDRGRAFERMAALHPLPMNLAGDGRPVSLTGIRTTWEIFHVLGVTPRLGRGFSPEDGLPGQEQRVVLSHPLWQGRFAARQDIVGSRINVNGAPAMVVGVLPPMATLPDLHADVWLAWPLVRGEDLGGRFHGVVARLKPGVGIRQAQEELSGIAEQLSGERPGMNKGWGAVVAPFLGDATGPVRLPLLVLLGAVGFILLIACANVANLLLMRSVGRLREFSIRASLGAGRWRIVRQLLAESLLLALAGCAAGIAAGYWVLKGMLAILPAAVSLPRIESVQLDARVLLFALGLSVLTVVVFGLFPALRISRTDLRGALQQNSLRTCVGGHRAFRRAFVVSELALALLLLAGAGLLLRSFATLVRVDPGFATDRLLTMAVFTSPVRYADPRIRSEYLDRLLDEIRAVPGVEAASSVHFLPLTGGTSVSCFSRADQPPPAEGESPSAQFLSVTRDYFRTMHMPVLSGRAFGERDRFGSPGVVVVNRAFAERYYPGEDPLGKRLSLCWHVGSAEVVGVVADARQTELRRVPEPTIFVANAHGPMYFATLVVRSGGDASAVARAAEAAVHRVDPEQAVSKVQTMDEVFSDSVARPRVQLALMLLFAGIAVALAAIGLYGVVSYSVSQRAQEIGIRIAFGASRGDVGRLVLREALAVAGVGLLIGLAGALALTRVLRSLLFEIAPTDPLTLVLVSLVLLLVVVAAAILPARRAARVDPMVALRYE